MYAVTEERLIIQLKEHGVNLTQNRIAVFKLLTETNTALSVSAIMKLSKTLLDRISVHRALTHFLKKGIVEIVPNNGGNARYILASTNKEIIKSRNNKCAYFICSACQHTQLILEPVHISFKSLTQHQVRKYSLIIEGLCNSCK